MSHHPKDSECQVPSHEVSNDRSPATGFANVQIFSHLKVPNIQGEDAFAVTTHCLVVADGATAKTDFAIAPDRTGGEIVAWTVAECAANSARNGIELVAELNREVAAVLRNYGVVPLRRDPRMPSCVFAGARICGGRMVVTQVGDAGVRVNGQFGETLSVRNLVDELTSTARAQYIRLTGDVAGGRDFILPLLQAQAAYRNNPDHPLGFGVIDGVENPYNFVVTRVFDLASVKSIEIFSDGYPNIPEHISLEAWEDAYRQVLPDDPHRCLTYPATKMLDDRTVIMADIGKL